MAEFEREREPERQTNQPEATPNPTGEAESLSRQGGQAGGPVQPVPPELPILPLKGTVVFPLTVVPLVAGQARTLRLIDDAINGDRLVGLVMQKDAEQAGDAIK